MYTTSECLGLNGLADASRVGALRRFEWEQTELQKRKIIGRDLRGSCRSACDNRCRQLGGTIDPTASRASNITARPSRAIEQCGRWSARGEKPPRLRELPGGCLAIERHAWGRGTNARNIWMVGHLFPRPGLATASWGGKQWEKVAAGPCVEILEVFSSGACYLEVKDAGTVPHRSMVCVVVVFISACTECGVDSDERTHERKAACAAVINRWLIAGIQAHLPAEFKGQSNG